MSSRCLPTWQQPAVLVCQGLSHFLTQKSPEFQGTPPQSRANQADWSPLQELKVEGSYLSKADAPHEGGLVLGWYGPESVAQSGAFWHF